MNSRVCIIGSGPGGGTAAINLVKSKKAQVIVIDIDTLASSFKPTTQLPYISIGSPFNIDVTRGYGFGGTSNLWHGVLTEFDDADFHLLDEWMQSDMSKEIKNAYKEINSLFAMSHREANIYGRKEKNGVYNLIESSKEFIKKEFFIQKKPLNVRNELRKLSKYNNLHLIEKATVLYLVSDKKDPHQVSGVVIHRNGKEELIEADYFILAAGSMESPRILLQGHEENHFNLNNRNIGKYWMDHPWGVIGHIQSDQYFRLKMTDVKYCRDYNYRVGYRIKPESNAQMLGTNHCIAIKPLFFGDYLQFREVMKTIMVNKSFSSIIKLFFKFNPYVVCSSLYFLLSEKLGWGPIVKKALVFCYLEQAPQEQSALTLSPNKDALGRRIPNVNWMLTEEKTNVQLINKKLTKLFKSSRQYRYIEYDDISLASGSHHSGTLRMGPNSECGVVDRNLKLFDANNVFVCDLSIFPNFGNSNPTFTLCAFSMRLAKHLIKQYL